MNATHYLPGQFPKPCTNCGRVHQNDAQWRALGAVGQLMVAPDAEEEDMPEGYVLESRNCPCGDTLSVRMELPKP